MQNASNSELRDAFIALSQWVWKSMGDARRLGLSFNEETITETILLSLARDFSHRGLSIKSFNKYEEGTSYAGGAPTGADWEFWFTDESKTWIGVRVQAKRLYLKSGQYEGLDGSGSQLQQLVNACAPAIPLYVLYNGPSKNTSQFSANIPPHRCCLECGWPFALEALWGCAFAMPGNILALNKPKPSDILDMIPWHCIWCWTSHSSDGHPPSLVRRVGRTLRTAYNRSRRVRRFDDEELEYLPSRRFDPIKEPPHWVRQVDVGGEPEDLPEGVSGIAIIRDTRNPERE